MGIKKRIEWIDVAKGYGIILVIMGHCFNLGNPIHKWIFSFHMPMFFILSGYCFNLDKYSGFLDVFQQKFKALIIPYIEFFILGSIVSYMIPEWRAGFSLKGFMVNLYWGYPTLTNITSTWYLIAVFVCSLLLFLIVTLSRKLKIKWFPYIFVGISGFAGYLIIAKNVLSSSINIGIGNITISFPGGRLPLTLDVCMTALVFFAIGYWLRQNYWETVIIKKHIGVLGLVFLFANFIIGVKLNSRVNLHGRTYGNVVYFYLAALSGSLAVFLLARVVCKSKIIKEFFMFYGQNSLLILGLQSLYIHLYVYILNKMTGNNYALYLDVPFMQGCWAFLIITFIAVPISCCIKLFIQKRYTININLLLWYKKDRI